MSKKKKQSTLEVGHIYRGKTILQDFQEITERRGNFIYYKSYTELGKLVGIYNLVVDMFVRKFPVKVSNKEFVDNCIK